MSSRTSAVTVDPETGDQMRECECEHRAPERFGKVINGEWRCLACSAPSNRKGDGETVGGDD